MGILLSNLGTLILATLRGPFWTTRGSLWATGRTISATWGSFSTAPRSPFQQLWEDPDEQLREPSEWLKDTTSPTTFATRGGPVSETHGPSHQPSFRNWETLLQQHRDPLQEPLDMFPLEEPSLILDLSSNIRNHFTSCARGDHFLQTSRLTILNVA